MSDRNYWTALRQRKISRRTMLGGSAKAGVGAAGLALVGCGDDDEPDAGAAAAERAASAAEEAAAAAVAAGDARAAESAAAAEAAAEAADAAGEASAAASEASAAASQAAAAADAAAALAAEAAESEDAANAAAAAEAAAAAAADAAAAASAAGDAAAAAVADAAAQAAEAAAQAARDAAAAVEAGTATAEAAQAAIDNAAEAAAAAAAAAGEASAAAGAAAATAQETAEAAAETAAAAVAAAQEAAEAAREAAESAAMAAEEDDMEEPSAATGEVDFDATLRIAIPVDSGGLDLMRSGSPGNGIISAVFNRTAEVDPETGNPVGNLVSWENPDEVTWNFTVKDGFFFHNGQQLTAEDIIFTYERAGGIAEYHMGGETSDHPGGWASARLPFGAQHWLSYEQTDMLHWTFTTDGPDATILGSTLWIPYVMSKADTENRGDAAVDASSMGSGYVRFLSHAEDTDFRFTRNDDYHNPYSRTPAANAYGASSPKNQIHLVRPEPLSRIAGIAAGEIDVAYLLSADVVAPIEDDPDFNVGWGWSATATTNIMPNLNIPDSPFHDDRVRRALNHAVNKQTIIDNLLTGEEDISYGLDPSMIASPIEALRAIGPYAYDPDLAKALLAEAGYADGLSTTLYYPPAWAAPYGPIALAVQQDFAAVGVDVELRGLPTGEYFGVARAQEAPGLFLFPFGLGAEQQGNLGALYTRDGTYALATYDDLEDAYQRQLQGVNIDDRTAAMTDLLVGHYQRAGFIYLVEMRAAHVTAPNVEWNLGTAQLANEQSFNQISVLTT